MYVGKRRRGLVLAAALMCLLIVMLFAAAVAQSLVLQRKASRAEARRTQAFWLAESAAGRAVTRCRADQDYAGETWQVSWSAQDREQIGVAHVEVRPEGDLRHIRIDARWSAEATADVRHHKEFTIRIGSGVKP